MTSNSSEYFSGCILKHSHYNEEYINAKQISDNLSSLSGRNTLIIIKYILELIMLWKELYNVIESSRYFNSTSKGNNFKKIISSMKIINKET